MNALNFIIPKKKKLKEINELIIFAGGKGTRLSEETLLKPKPMVQIGEMPILWHIMKYYSIYGIKKFYICLGYKGYIIKDFFLNYHNFNSSLKINLKTNEINFIDKAKDDWEIILLDTGLNSGTANRLLQTIRKTNGKNIFFTYGDGLANVNLFQLEQSHLANKKQLSITGSDYKSRFGKIYFNGKNPIFSEKPSERKSLINAGFGVVNKSIIKVLEKYDCKEMLEEKPMKQISKNKNLNVYVHKGFFHPMDTARDKMILQKLWDENKAPWKIWI